MARLKRTAERIMEGITEGIAKILEGLPAWKPEHGEVGCTKGRLRRNLCRQEFAEGPTFAVSTAEFHDSIISCS